MKRTYDWPFIYFAHIGKTGGTSVRHAAFKHFGEDRCVCLYAEGRSANTGGAFEIFTATMEETGKPRAAAMKVLDLLEDKRPAFFSTHNPMFGRFIPAEKTVAFIREPVDRAISEYNFWKKTSAVRLNRLRLTPSTPVTRTSNPPLCAISTLIRSPSSGSRQNMKHPLRWSIVSLA
ncbi:MAG: sulfotransferase family 2 domain-containing protein [Paracoccaceae bacterium]|nr:sulfotransferase family 2 domain-containing protein [Paracoccaceae bacterium]